MDEVIQLEHLSRAAEGTSANADWSYANMPFVAHDNRQSPKQDVAGPVVAAVVAATVAKTQQRLWADTQANLGAKAAYPLNLQAQSSCTAQS